MIKIVFIGSSNSRVEKTIIRTLNASITCALHENQNDEFYS